MVSTMERHMRDAALIPTTIIGSMPKPGWLTSEWYSVAENWRPSGAALDEAFDDATRLALLDQEQAGIDIVCDGEQRRPSHHSYFLAHLGTAPENAARAETALRQQLERVQHEPVSEEELGVAKAFLLGHLAMDRRTNARQAWYLAAYEEDSVGYEFLGRYVDAVRAVTAADVQRAAQRYLAVLRTVVVQPTPP